MQQQFYTFTLVKQQFYTFNTGAMMKDLTVEQ